MKQQFTFFKSKPSIKQHGGSLAVRKRRGHRPLNIRKSMHITLKSHFAIGGRCLFKHKKMILFVIRKASKRFNIKVYNYAICGNHIHLLIKGYDRVEIQNFFRVVCGHTAQNILKTHPLSLKEMRASNAKGGAPTPCKKNQRKFWSYLVYSRIVSWGTDFRNVEKYIDRNVLELLQVIPFQLRSVTLVKKRLINTS